MKLKRYAIVLLVVIGLVACDDYAEGELRIPLPGPIKEDVSITKKQDTQAVLLEEYSGWSCTNCPKAAEELENLKHSYQGQLVALTIHAGHFATPSKSNNYLDLRTEYGTSLYNSFNINTNPIGMVNRSGSMLQYGVWATTIESELSSMSHSLNIGLGARQTGNQIYVGVELSALKNISENLLLTLVVAEDGIVGVQMDGSKKDTAYTFHNVLRENALVNLPINTQPISADETIKRNYAINIGSGWNLSNCRVIAIVTNQENGKVIQANEIEL
ncbi:MAG: Omp28-related outer membrane protein [Bacteroidota bacterium]|nr:Omp28-related outer membrane protein [Bacteroidota bacterium]